MKFHTKRHWMESIKHLDTYLVTLSKCDGEMRI